MENNFKIALSWFLDNLNLQIDDIELEKQGVTLDFYWDTVDVRRAVLGMAAFYRPLEDRKKYVFEEESFKDQRSLVSCLAGADWLGKIQMLLPHQAEFLHLLDLEFGVGPIGPPQGGAKQFFGDIGLTQPLDWEKVHEMDSTQILSIVKDQAGSAEKLFKAVQSIRGTWKTRLDSMRREGLLELRTETFDLTSILRSERFERLRRSFDGYKHRRRFPVSNYADSVALCLLVDSVKQYTDGRTKRLPRFFASTSFEDVTREAGVDKELFYRGSVPQDLSVLRDADYYIFRSTFHPPLKVLQAAGDHASQFVGELREVQQRVSEILQARRPLTSEVVDRIRVKGLPLSEVIRDLRRYWFLEKVWLPFAATTDVRQAAAEYVHAARKMSEDPKFRASVEREVEATKDILRDNVREYTWVGGLWDDLEEAVEDLNSTYTALTGQNTDYFRTFGLLRFGIPDDYHQQIEDLLKALFFGGQQAEYDARSSIVGLCYSGRLNPQREEAALIVSACILWVVRMEKQLVRLLSDARTHTKQQHYSLRILYAAAAFRVHDHVADGQSVLSQLEIEYSDQADRYRRLELAIGIAYLYFHLWICMGHEASWRPALARNPLGRDGSEFIDRAIDYAKKAYFETSVTNLKKRVYALNQYLYYLVEGAEDERISEMDEAATELLRFAANPEVWQYRFDDTLARYYHRRATLATTAGERRELLKTAKRYTDRASAAAHGDREVEDNSSIIQIAIAEVER